MRLPASIQDSRRLLRCARSDRRDGVPVDSRLGAQLGDFGVVAVRAEGGEAVTGGGLDGRVHAEPLQRDLLLHLKLVQPHHHLLAAFDGLLRRVGRVLDLVLHVAVLDGRQRAADLAHLREITARGGFHFVALGQLLDQVRARQRVDRNPPHPTDRR